MPNLRTPESSPDFLLQPLRESHLKVVFAADSLAGFTRDGFAGAPPHPLYTFGVYARRSQRSQNTRERFADPSQIFWE